jgi:hypothetical protein
LKTAAARMALALSLLAIAACGGEPQEAGAPTAPEPAVTTTPSPQPTAQAVEPGTIPAAFHGVWDNEAGTCDPASDMRMEIGARSITFYESHGTVTAATTGAPGVVEIDLAMEGEGDTWTQRMQLSLDGEDADAGLLVRYDDDEAQRSTGVIMRRKRCPA